MSRQISAIYENGSFKPIEPVDLLEHTVVTLTVDEAIPPTSEWDAKRAAAAVDRISSLPVEGPTTVEAVGRNHDRYLYGNKTDKPMTERK